MAEESEWRGPEVLLARIATHANVPAVRLYGPPGKAVILVPLALYSLAKFSPVFSSDPPSTIGMLPD
jgi:hypothetical protein